MQKVSATHPYCLPERASRRVHSCLIYETARRFQPLEVISTVRRTCTDDLLALIVRPETTQAVTHLAHPCSRDSIEQTHEASSADGLANRLDHALVTGGLESDLGEIERVSDRRGNCRRHALSDSVNIKYASSASSTHHRARTDMAPSSSTRPEVETTPRLSTPATALTPPGAPSTLQGCLRSSSSLCDRDRRCLRPRARCRHCRSRRRGPVLVAIENVSSASTTLAFAAGDELISRSPWSRLRDKKERECGCPPKCCRNPRGLRLGKQSWEYNAPHFS